MWPARSLQLFPISRKASKFGNLSANFPATFQVQDEQDPSKPDVLSGRTSSSPMVSPVWKHSTKSLVEVVNREVLDRSCFLSTLGTPVALMGPHTAHFSSLSSVSPRNVLYPLKCSFRKDSRGNDAVPGGEGLQSGQVVEDIQPLYPLWCSPNY